MPTRWNGVSKTTWITAISVVLTFWGSSSFAQSQKAVTVKADTFLDQSRFITAHSQAAAKLDSNACKTIRGGLVNHHVLASDLLEQFFQGVALCRPTITRLIILSPDHFFQGKTTVSTARLKYETQGKTIATDDRAIDRLLALKVASVEPELFRKEHGIAALVPFAAENFPGVTLVPIAIRSDLSRAEANQLVHALKPLLDHDTLFIVSSDMSHYLPAERAKIKDQETERALQKNDQAFFWRAQDDHLDLGKGLWIALKLLKQPKFQLLRHGISSDYAGSTAYTTSYFTGLWK